MSLFDKASPSAVLPTYARADLAFTHGEGVWIWAEDGRRFLDLGAGIAVNALGHAHPALVDTVTAQASKLWHVSNLYRVPEQERLARLLTDATFADTVFFTNSGTEATELAVKMVRKHWAKADQDRPEILTFQGAFHGRSYAGISASGGAKMVDGFAPLLPGFRHLPFGDHDALRAAVSDRTAAILVEPIQGEGGIRVLPDACLKGLRDLCDETGALLVLDEIQCGMGRTGRLFAHEWAGIVPDIMTVAKGIGGGFPLGAVLATAAASDGMTAGTHGSTYGGNPLGCAIGATVMEIVADETFLADVRRKAGRIRQSLEGLVALYPQLFAEVRGTGLMLGLKARVPAADVVRAGYEVEVLTVPAAEDVVRVLPALTITDAEIDEAMHRLDAAAARLAARTP